MRKVPVRLAGFLKPFGGMALLPLKRGFGCLFSPHNERFSLTLDFGLYLK
jgi:hypothetical protein